MKQTRFFKLLLLLFIVANTLHGNNKRIDLAGEWKLMLDTLNVGDQQNWQNKQFSETVMLPGSLTSNNIGNNITLDTKWTGTNWSDSSWYKRPEFEKFRNPKNPKFSFWLTPLKEYVGVAWYQKTVNIDSKWIKNDIFLNLERCHWETTVWVNGELIGTKNSLSTAHRYHLSPKIIKGNNLLTIRVDNRIKDIDPGKDAHSISDNTQTNWNGIVGDLSLQASALISVSNVKVTPNVAQNKALVEFVVNNNSSKNVTRKINFDVESYNSATKHKLSDLSKKFIINKGENRFSLTLDMGENVQLWDEHSPALYKLKLNIDNISNSDFITTFGMREVKVVGSQFYVNNKPVYLRGTLECAIFPLTGFPPTDVVAWKKIMAKIQDFGLNHIRFHSWCPPRAAFQAADEAGVYLQIEAAAWATIGDGKGIDTFIYDESERIVTDYGNHPSFCLMAYGNEPHGANHKAYLSKFVAFWKEKDGRRLYTSAAGWPELPENDFHNIPGPRIQHWNAGLKSSINANAPQTKSDYSSIIQNRKIPVVSHEIGQWCAFPNFDEVKKYTGVLKPKNFELFKEHLTDKNMGHQANDFLMASGKLQVLCYKADIEASLRTKNMAGFQLLDLRDFPGQGTALVGVLDAFWDEKPYVSANEYKQFCNKVVPLARLPKMVYTTADTLLADIELANFGGEELKQTTVNWEIVNNNNTVVKSGKFQSRDYPIGNGFNAGRINVMLNDFISPSKYIIRTAVEGTDYSNQWDIWVYPAKLADNEQDIFITDKLDAQALKQLNDGKNVLLTVNKSMLKPEMGGNVELGFSTVFWNTSWTKNQAPHTLGILCDPKHPALAHFPTEYHSNWQWWEILKDGAAINTDNFPVDFKAIVQPIHTWFDNQRLALIFEANVLNGKLMVVGADLHSELEKRIVARQLKYSLINYIQSGSFNPKNRLSHKDIESLMNSEK